jgi:hypothetical protein
LHCSPQAFRRCLPQKQLGRSLATKQDQTPDAVKEAIMWPKGGPGVPGAAEAIWL